MQFSSRILDWVSQSLTCSSVFARVLCPFGFINGQYAAKSQHLHAVLSHGSICGTSDNLVYVCGLFLCDFSCWLSWVSFLHSRVVADGPFLFLKSGWPDGRCVSDCENSFLVIRERLEPATIGGVGVTLPPPWVTSVKGPLCCIPSEVLWPHP